jgi:hypothetical protein
MDSDTRVKQIMGEFVKIALERNRIYGTPMPEDTYRCRHQNWSDKPLARTAGSLYRSFGSIQCCLGLAGDLTFCD